MALDFQQVHEQVRQLGEQAPQREQRLNELRQQAHELLERYAGDLDALRDRVSMIVRSHDPSLRCAVPVNEPLTAHLALPELPPNLTILAADGSQIAPDRHAPVEYCLINVGAVQMRHGTAEPAVTKVTSQLFYAEEIENSHRLDHRCYPGPPPRLE